jgi:hypothetical protein
MTANDSQLMRIGRTARGYFCDAERIGPLATNGFLGRLLLGPLGLMSITIPYHEQTRLNSPIDIRPADASGDDARATTVRQRDHNSETA